MKHRLIRKEAFRIVGLMKRVPIVFHGINPGIMELSLQLNEDIIRQLKELSDMEPNGIISASANFSLGRMEEKGELDHYICVATTHQATGSFEVLEVSASDWLVFDISGHFPQAVQLAWGEIYAKWLPGTHFEPTGGPEILWHEDANLSNPNHLAQIWIPVKLKAKKTSALA